MAFRAPEPDAQPEAVAEPGGPRAAGVVAEPDAPQVVAGVAAPDAQREAAAPDAAMAAEPDAQQAAVVEPDVQRVAAAEPDAQQAAVVEPDVQRVAAAESDAQQAVAAASGVQPAVALASDAQQQAAEAVVSDVQPGAVLAPMVEAVKLRARPLVASVEPAETAAVRLWFRATMVSAAALEPALVSAAKVRAAADR